MSRLPNFLVVGAHKSGTTSLYEYLRQHPDVFLSDRKEGLFFSELHATAGPLHAQKNAEVLRTFEEYAALFEPARDEPAIGDVSPDYLYRYETSIANIRRHLPAPPRIIAILRNPVERAYSNYTFYRKHNMESLSFEEALDREAERRAAGWWWAFRYAEIGLYHDQVKAYQDTFDQVKIILTEDLRRDAAGTLGGLFEFLEIDPNPPVDTSRQYNVSGIPQSAKIHRLLTTRTPVKAVVARIARTVLFPFASPAERRRRFGRLARRLSERNLERVPMRPETRERLIAFYRDDVLRLQERLGRDLGHWLSAEKT
jgi:hypothetical protein